MNVLFVYSLQDYESCEKPLQTLGQIQFGISYISSYLKAHEHNTRLLVLTRATKDSVIDKYLETFRPELICFTAVATEFDFILDRARYIKSRYKHAFLIIGGVHVSLNPDDSILDVFDALCIGEGEIPTLELVRQLEKRTSPSGIANLWIKQGNKIEKNPTAPFLKDIDSLPFPDREMWFDWVSNVSTRCYILLARGCPFNCTYCCNHALRKLSKGSYVRMRSPENIITELEEIIKKIPNVKEVYLEVETFGANMAWAIDLCSALAAFNKKNDNSLSYGVNLRITPNGKYEELFSAMKESSFSYINIGLESGSERVRREILRRNYSNQNIIDAVELARTYGLKVCFYNLIGIPGETFEDFKETIRMNRINLPDWHYLSIFFPYPGTDLYFLCKEKGLLKQDLNPGMERRQSVLDLHGFSRKQIQKGFIWFDYYAFKGYLPLHKILARVFVNKLHSSYYLNRLYRFFTRYRIFRSLKQFFKSY